MSRLDDYFDTSLKGTDLVADLFKGGTDHAAVWLTTGIVVPFVCVVMAPFWALEKVCGLLSRK
jgi:hypothetical protein